MVKISSTAFIIVARMNYSAPCLRNIPATACFLLRWPNIWCAMPRRSKPSRKMPIDLLSTPLPFMGKRRFLYGLHGQIRFFLTHREGLSIIALVSLKFGPRKGTKFPLWMTTVTVPANAMILVSDKDSMHRLLHGSALFCFLSAEFGCSWADG